MHGETPTAHAHRRVAVGARRWFFCRYYRRGLCVLILRGLGRRGAAARLSRRPHPRRVKMYRLDGHPRLKKLDIQGSLLFSNRPKKRALRCQNGVKRPKLPETGYYWSCSRQYGGVVRVGSICLSPGLGTQKKVGHSGLPNSFILRRSCQDGARSVYRCTKANSLLVGS